MTEIPNWLNFHLWNSKQIQNQSRQDQELVWISLGQTGLSIYSGLPKKFPMPLSCLGTFWEMLNVRLYNKNILTITSNSMWE